MMCVKSPSSDRETRLGRTSREVACSLAEARCQQADVARPRMPSRQNVNDFDASFPLTVRMKLASNVSVGLPIKLAARAAAAAIALQVAGCATAPLDQAGSLRSYNDLTQSDGLLTRSLLRVDKERVLAAKTVKIIPTAFSEPATRVSFTAVQRNLVTNAVDRSLCAGLSERFEVVSRSEPADLTIHAVVTHAAATDTVAVGLSKGATVAKDVLLPGVPVPVPRIPIGLGSLSLEAEARDLSGNQRAAMIWGRGANALFDSGRVAEEADAYSLAAAFGGDFSAMLITGMTPFETKIPSLPSKEKLSFLLGNAPKYSACEAFGRSPGLVGLIGERVGTPPGWTDSGSTTQAN